MATNNTTTTPYAGTAGHKSGAGVNQSALNQEAGLINGPGIGAFDKLLGAEPQVRWELHPVRNPPGSCQLIFFLASCRPPPISFVSISR